MEKKFVDNSEKRKIEIIAKKTIEFYLAMWDRDSNIHASDIIDVVIDLLHYSESQNWSVDFILKAIRGTFKIESYNYERSSGLPI